MRIPQSTLAAVMIAIRDFPEPVQAGIARIRVFLLPINRLFSLTDRAKVSAITLHVSSSPLLVTFPLMLQSSRMAATSSSVGIIAFTLLLVGFWLTAKII